MKNYQKLTILYYLNRKKATPDDKAPIYVRITIDGRKKEFSLGFKTHIDQWNNKMKNVVAVEPDAAVINAQILKSEIELKQRFLELQVMNEYVTPEMVKRDYFRKRMAELNKDNDRQNSFNFSGTVDTLILNFFELKKAERKTAKLKNVKAKMIAETRLFITRQNLLKKVELHQQKGESLFANKDLEKTLLNATDFLLIDFLHKVMKEQRSGATLVRWKMTKSKILNFLWRHYRKVDVSLTDVEFSFAGRLFDHLTTEDACGYNAAMKHIKNVKQIIDLAVNNDWIIRNPIGRYRCTYIEHPRQELNMQDILKLLSTDFGEPLNTVRDVFLFCCFTGFAYEDTRRLKEENLISDTEGRKWISAKRSKTNEEEIVPVLPLVEQIMTRYKDHPARVINGYLIPTYSNQYNNDQLKKIAAASDIQKVLTSHVARYTFAVTVTLENDIPLNVVGKMLGHRSIRTTEKYAKVTRKKISDNMEGLSQKLFTADGILRHEAIAR